MENAARRAESATALPPITRAWHDTRAAVKQQRAQSKMESRTWATHLACMLKTLEGLRLDADDLYSRLVGNDETDRAAIVRSLSIALDRTTACFRFAAGHALDIVNKPSGEERDACVVSIVNEGGVSRRSGFLYLD